MTWKKDWEVGGRSSRSRNKKRNARKCKTVRTECASSREKIVVDGEEVDDVEEFTSLRANLDKEGGGSKDLVHRLQNWRGAFQRLRRIWAAKEIGRRAKITKNDEPKLNSFQFQCLRRMLHITWRQRITNESSWIGWDQWHKLWSGTKKVELVRSHTKERRWERLLYRARMDSWRSEDKRKTKNYLEKDSRDCPMTNVCI